MLWELFVSSPRVEEGMREDGWKGGVLVTSQHAVWIQWNELALWQHCQASGTMLYHFPAEDSNGGRPLMTKEKWTLVQYMMKDKGYSAWMKQLGLCCRTGSQLQGDHNDKY